MRWPCLWPCCPIWRLCPMWQACHSPKRAGAEVRSSGELLMESTPCLRPHRPGLCGLPAFQRQPPERISQLLRNVLRAHARVYSHFLTYTLSLFDVHTAGRCDPAGRCDSALPVALALRSPSISPISQREYATASVPTCWCPLLPPCAFRTDRPTSMDPRPWFCEHGSARMDR